MDHRTLSDAVLPIESLKEGVLDALKKGPVVVSAPTGSGKSTQLPRWLMAQGRVLVVEPRRVACQSLARRVAELEGCELGVQVGYVVRDDARANDRTQLVFATPGVVLRWLQSGRAARFDALVVDEFHERSLDVDLVLALARGGEQRLVVMSATLEGDKVARYLGGVHLEGEGRMFPVQVHHLPQQTIDPDLRGLEQRVSEALRRAEQDSGDALVFLPGKAEIASVQSSLRGLSEWEVLTLHGGLSLDEQSRVFRPGPRRRAVLCTNVAETSLTIPRVGVVVDSGLVRRTRYHKGRGTLSLLPIAMDSAQQRAGRAGRLGPGVCYRLWSPRAKLLERTPPEVHRESLVPLVLAATACGARVSRLKLPDPPKPYALKAAQDQLRALGALDESDALTERGARLFGMPLDAALGRLLVEAEQRDTLHMVVPLCASLVISRPLFGPRPEDPDHDLRAGGCDAVARIRAVCEGDPRRHQLNRVALREARQSLKRLQRLFGMGRSGTPRIDRKALAMTVLSAWPDCAHVARRRKRNVAWANGGTELDLGRECALDDEKTRAILVLDSRSLADRNNKARVLITAAMPVPLVWLVEAGRGREKLGGVNLERGRVVAKVERVYAGLVIDTRERAPEGEVLRQAVRELVLRGSLFKGAKKQLAQRHERASLAARLDREPALLPLPEWLDQRLEQLGLQEADELSLLSAEDLMPDPLPQELQSRLDRKYPPVFSIGDGNYTLRYDVGTRTATFEQTGGLRKTPPPLSLCPNLTGWKLVWEHRGKRRTMRG